MTYKSPKPQAHALFGKAVAVIGDLDRSGYNGKIFLQEDNFSMSPSFDEN